MYKFFLPLMLGLAGCMSCNTSDAGSDSSEVEEPQIAFDSCSQNIGDHPCNFALKNQHGEEIELYDSYGKIIIVDFSVMWCGPCQSMGMVADTIVSDYGDDKVEWITLIIEDESGNPPDQEALARWATSLGITGDVLASSREIIDPTATTGYPITAWPTYVVIDEKMVLQYGVKGWNEMTLRGILDSMIAE